MPDCHRRFVKRLWNAGSLWLGQDGIVHSAAVAYYAALSVFPLLVLSTAAAHLVAEVLELDVRIHDPLLEAVEQEASLQLRLALEEALSATQDLHHLGGPISGAWLFVTSLLVFAQLDRGFRNLWSNPRQRPENNLIATVIELISNRTRAVLLLFGFGLVLACVFAISHGLDTVSRASGPSVVWSQLIGRSSHVVLHMLIHTIFFAVVFRVLTPMAVAMKDAIHSALLLAVCWEIGRQAMSSAIVRDYQSLYGVSGALLVILLWIYYASMLIFYAAAYLRCLVDERATSLGA